MLKFARNALVEENIIFPEKKSISWDYFVHLYLLQHQEELSLTNKLNFEQTACTSAIKFDFFNSRHPFAKSFKAPIGNFNLTIQENVKIETHRQ